MTHREPRRLRAIGAVGTAVLALGSCTATPQPRPGPPPRRPVAVVVASFNFPESSLLAELYAQSIEHAGIPVRRELDLGPRELVLPALDQGMVDLVPEYLGTVVRAVRPSTPISGVRQGVLLARLRATIARRGLVALHPSRAQDRNAVAVTAATARRLRLRTLSDLAAVSRRLVLGGPSECPRRPLCLPGLRRVYGIRFRRFAAYDDLAQRSAALDQGVIDAEVTFTTDPRLADGSLVALRDNRHLQPDEAVVPILSRAVLARFGARLRRAVDVVSARLTSPALAFLDWRVMVEGRRVGSEARGWLQRHGVLPP
ncbi:MAG TPA: ABC transporter substrate-binding protein [Jatrophihabitans sp.]